MEDRKVTWEILLLYAIVVGDERWIYFENLKPKKSWLSRSDAGFPTPKSNPFGNKAMLCFCGDQSGIVYYEFVKPIETVNMQSYPQKKIINLNHTLIEKRQK